MNAKMVSDTLFNWVEKGIITIRILTIGTFFVCVGMWIAGAPFPESLDFTWKLILGFWFGTEGMKVAFEVAKDAYEKEHVERMKLERELRKK